MYILKSEIEEVEEIEEISIFTVWFVNYNKYFLVVLSSFMFLTFIIILYI